MWASPIAPRDAETKMELVGTSGWEGEMEKQRERWRNREKDRERERKMEKGRERWRKREKDGEEEYGVDLVEDFFGCSICLVECTYCLPVVPKAKRNLQRRIIGAPS